MRAYDVVTGTGAVDAAEQDFGNFGASVDEFDEDVSPSARNLPQCAPQSSRIRGDTVLARPGMPEAWKTQSGVHAAHKDPDDEELVEEAQFACFHPGCGSMYATTADLTVHKKKRH